MNKESNFQLRLIDELYSMFPGCMVLKQDPSNIQGIPDLLVLYKNKWAALECKRNLEASKQANQVYYVNEMDGMSFAAFICPENMREVLDDLQHTFTS